MRSGHNPINDNKLLSQMTDDFNRDKNPLLVNNLFNSTNSPNIMQELTKERNKPDQAFLRDDKKEGRSDLEQPRNIF
jgi:hypothetical protein